MAKKFTENLDEYGKVISISTELRGSSLLSQPELNKGTSFSREEREKFGLLGKLPYRYETIEQQAARYYRQYRKKQSPLGRNITLNALKQHNLTLFYRLASDHLLEMLPIIYTPTIGDAVQNFSFEFNKPSGLMIGYPDRDHIEEILENRVHHDLDLIIITDGEGVLGIGDWGIGGMDICVGKLMVYTLCGGINPLRTLPIQLDMGTNNEKLLSDPMYLGWRHSRINGQEYDDFIDKVISAIQKKFPHVYLHWEDFGRDNARKNLDRYRNQLCTFNDDIQGTGATALACILSGLKAKNEALENQRIVIFGAGTAGVGVADQIYQGMLAQGIPENKAREKFWLIDRDGLILNDHANVLYFQKPFARDRESVAHWQLRSPNTITLADVVDNVKPTILMGCSAVSGAFNKDIIHAMASHVERPMIFPLSNPTANAEATPLDIYEWTEGKAIVATGSPFAPIQFNGREISIPQCNNAYIFPGLGLGIIAAKATRVTEEMIEVACNTLSEFSPAARDPLAPILPSFTDMEKISKAIALKVATLAREQNYSAISKEVDLEKRIEAIYWKPEYQPFLEE
jgi:malate dehydrogenase (oxaloacetate-decarboxylating)